jgi:glucose/arabinose dehydrogenase
MSRTAPRDLVGCVGRKEGVVNRYCLFLILTVMLGPTALGAQQSERRDFGLPDGPQVFTDSGGQPFRVVPMKGLTQPWALAFLPNGDILVTELGGRLRIIRNGVVDPQPISGVPEVNRGASRAGLLDVAVHPRYAENKFIYLTYSKPMPGNPQDAFTWVGATERKPSRKRDAATVTLARARFDGGHTLTEVKDMFVSDAWSQSASASRIAFLRDGTIIMTVGSSGRTQIGTVEDAQNPANHGGKILRLNDDGSAPKDNPFVGKPGYRPEIYALGIRNAIGLFVHPQTGEIWETENGPMGGDEINIIRPGRNYGYPVVSYGIDYSGSPTGGLSGPSTPDRRHEGMEEPFLFWNPSPAVAGITIYTGDQVPAWKGNIFVAAMGGPGLGSRQLHRIILSQKGLPQRFGNVTMLAELRQRLRDVKQGPDGLLYLTVDEAKGAVLRLEPVQGEGPDAR